MDWAIESGPWVAALMLLGCSFDADSLGGGTNGGSSSTAATSPSSSSMGGGPGGPGTSAVDDTGEDTTTGPSSSGPVLEISDGPVLDLGPVPAGMVGQRMLSVTNVGDATATTVAGQPLDPGFDYPGGRFPGTSGDCGPSLEPGASCTVVLAFSPPQWGPYETTLRVTHDAGEAMRPVRGDGEGRSDNLLRNPGGEDGGVDPPMSWVDNSPGIWTTGSWFPPAEGNLFIASNDGPNDTDYWLVQPIALDAYLDLVQSGGLRVELTGQARNFSAGDDQYRMQLRFVDARNELVGEWDSGLQTAGDWTPVSHEQPLPATTDLIRVRLGCRKSFGVACDAYYDDLSVRLSYP